MNKIEVSLNGATIEQSYSGMKNNPDLSVGAEVGNAGADLTSDSGKTNEKYDSINILEKYEQKTVKYQETLKMDVENIDKNIKTNI